jgi:hypothetical protein
MRPSYYVFVTEGGLQGRLVIHGLFYNGRKAERAFRKLRSNGPDGSYTMLLENGSEETTYWKSSELSVYAGYLGDHIPTKREPWKKSFFDTSEEEYQELASRIPVKLLKEIASYEKDYIENRGDTRWSAWKRAYLPRALYNWI